MKVFLLAMLLALYVSFSATAKADQLFAAVKNGHILQYCLKVDGRTAPQRLERHKAMGIPVEIEFVGNRCASTIGCVASKATERGLWTARLRWEPKEGRFCEFLRFEGRGQRVEGHWENFRVAEIHAPTLGNELEDFSRRNLRVSSARYHARFGVVKGAAFSNFFDAVLVSR